jgi:hypothetical protein
MPSARAVRQCSNHPELGIIFGGGSDQRAVKKISMIDLNNAFRLRLSISTSILAGLAHAAGLFCARKTT